jgi:hypothetical protein
LAIADLLDKDFESVYRLADFLGLLLFPGDYFGFQMNDRQRLLANHFIRAVPKHLLGATIKDRDESACGRWQ